MGESDWSLLIGISKTPCVDITSNIFFRDSGMASYYKGKEIQTGKERGDTNSTGQKLNISDL